MALATTNYGNRCHALLSNPIPLSQDPVTEGGHVHGVLCLQSEATVDELSGPTSANNIMAAATRDFSGLTLAS